jgi:hypothetical protein
MNCILLSLGTPVNRQIQNTFTFVITTRPISIAERSEASTVFGLSNVEIAGSNPARGMDVCLRFSVLCCPVCR